MARAIANQFTFGGPAHSRGVILDAIEIGNEVDLYRVNGLRAKNWTFADWTVQ